MSHLTIAAIQLTSTEDVATNIQTSVHLVKRAASAGAQLVGLPENFAYLGSDRDHRASLAESISEGAPGPILEAMQQVAKETGAWLLLGGFPERGTVVATGAARDAATPRIRNTSILLTPGGAIAAVYRKIHLFDVDVPGGLRFRESESVEPGDGVVVAETPWGGLGLTICYDLRFPELYRAIAQRGARLLAVPAAFTMETGKDHWHLLLRARAVENQVYLFAPAQFGHHGGQRRSYGHALVVDPWGVVIAECGNHEGFALATVDFDYQDQVRRNLPCLAHRRL
ncbi:MAG TPA: carbon-nitrogen hydrolase family protein [Polyangia bacterium]|jgi:predicted amidohydrolase|nr:carbon-nitrogen hydrolase family protein [Polyangia bacterium]